MSRRISELEELHLLEPQNHATPLFPATSQPVGFDQSLAFSGFAAFTPITVTSGTVLGNADLERNQR